MNYSFFMPETKNYQSNTTKEQYYRILFQYSWYLKIFSCSYSFRSGVGEPQASRAGVLQAFDVSLIQYSWFIWINYTLNMSWTSPETNNELIVWFSCVDPGWYLKPEALSSPPLVYRFDFYIFPGVSFYLVLILSNMSCKSSELMIKQFLNLV